VTPHPPARLFLLGAAAVLLAGLDATMAGAQDRPRRGDTRRDAVIERLLDGAPVRTTELAADTPTAPSGTGSHEANRATPVGVRQ